MALTKRDTILTEREIDAHVSKVASLSTVARPYLGEIIASIKGYFTLVDLLVSVEELQALDRYNHTKRTDTVAASLTSRSTYYLFTGASVTEALRLDSEMLALLDSAAPTLALHVMCRDDQDTKALARARSRCEAASAAYAAYEKKVKKAFMSGRELGSFVTMKQAVMAYPELQGKI